MAGLSTSMFTLQQLYCDYLQQQTRWFIAQACYHRQLNLSCVLKKPSSVCHTGVISCCDALRLRKRHCVVVKN